MRKDPERIDRLKFLKLGGAGAVGLALFWPAILDSSVPTAQADDTDSTPSKLEPAAPIEPIVHAKVFIYHLVSAGKLASDLITLIDSGYQPISPEDLVKAFTGEKPITEKQPVFSVTLDDAYSSQYPAVLKAVKDIQDARGIFTPCTFFAPTKFNDPDRPINQIPGDTPCYRDWVHSYMTRDQLVDLIQQGHHIGNHTVNHANLLILDDGARNSEIAVGDERIQSLWDLAGVKRERKTFAYPYGKYNEATQTSLQALNFDLAFTEVETEDHPASQRLSIGRIRL